MDNKPYQCLSHNMKGNVWKMYGNCTLQSMESVCYKSMENVHYNTSLQESPCKIHRLIDVGIDYKTGHVPFLNDVGPSILLRILTCYM